MSSTQNKFPSASREDWRQLVSAALKGADPQSLNRRDEDGLEIEALYDIVVPETVPNAACALARLPVNPAVHIAHGWDICQPVLATGAPQSLNQLILEGLQDGVGTIWLQGLEAGNLAVDLPVIMQDVVLPAAGIALDAGNDALVQIAAFSAFAKSGNHSLSALRFQANIDPFAPAADAALLDQGLDYLACADAADRPAGLFRAQGWHWHNRGMTAVQELAYNLASLTEILRHAAARNLDLADVASRLSASLALPADLFDGIAKCRALRHCWGGVIAALGLDPDRHRLFIQAAVSLRMFSLADREVNMLRTTTALLGGAIGGADQLSAHPHDCLTGGDAMGRRLARMQQHLLIEESGLSRSLDPAGGAGFIEARTNQLAVAAWDLFQQIEADGGALAAHHAGRFAAWAKTAAGQRHAKLAAGDLTLVGVNLQPDGNIRDDVLPHWISVRRPAATIEALRRAAAKTPPRILLLQHQPTPVPQLAKLRALFAIGGMQPVHMQLDDASGKAVDTARPDLLVLLDCEFDQLDAALLSALSGLRHAGKAMTAARLLDAAAPLDLLADIVGVSLAEFYEGDA